MVELVAQLLLSVLVILTPVKLVRLFDVLEEGVSLHHEIM